MHSGHRERMKRRFRETELKGFDDVNVLELLLFYALPRQDTNPLAHRLLDRFGTFQDVIDAPYDELLTVSGVGDNVATLLKLIPAVCKRYTRSKQKRKIAYTRYEDLEDFVIPLFSFDSEETLFMICMDSGNRIIYCEPLSKGQLDSVYIEPRDVVRVAMNERASRVVLAHNHPSGVAMPSTSDIALTASLKDALGLFNIELLDHFIVAEETCISMRKHGFFR